MSLFGVPFYGSGVFYTGSGVDKPATLNYYRITDSDNLYVFYWTFNQDFLSPLITTFDYQVQIDTDINFSAPTSFETTTENANIILQGYTVSGAYAATNITGGDTLLIDIDGDGPQPIVLNVNITGASIAADIQAKVSILTAADPANQLAYNNFVATFNPTYNQYTLTSGGTGINSTVSVIGGTAAPSLFLGVSEGGYEVRGNTTLLDVTPQRILIVEDGLGLFTDVTGVASTPGAREFIANLTSGQISFNDADVPATIKIIYVAATSGDIIQFQRGNVAKAFTVPVFNRIDSDRLTFYARVRLRSASSYGPFSDTILVQTIANVTKETADRMLQRLPDRHVYPTDEAYKPLADRKSNISSIFEAYAAEFDKEYLEKENTIRDVRQERTRDERLYDLIGSRFQYQKPSTMEFVDYRFLVSGAKEAALLGGTYQAVKYIGRAFTGVDPEIIPISRIVNLVTAAESQTIETVQPPALPAYDVTLESPARIDPVIPGALISGPITSVTDALVVASSSPFTVTLSQRPATIPVVNAGAFVYTNDAPAVGQFSVNFLTKVLTFNSADASTPVSVMYTPYPDVSAGTIDINVDGDGVQTVVLGAGPFASKAEVAAEIQSKVRALTAVTPANQASFANFIAIYDAATDRFTLISGNQTPTTASTVVVTSGTAAVALALTVGVTSTTGLTYVNYPAVPAVGEFVCDFATGDGGVLTFNAASAFTSYIVVYKKKDTIHTYLSPATPPALYSRTEAGFGIKIILNNPLALTLDYDNISFLLKEILPAHTKFILV